MQKRVWDGYGGEGDVKAHMEKKKKKHIWRLKFTSPGWDRRVLQNQSKVCLISPKDTNAQLKIVAAELSWAYHMNQYALLYRAFHCSTEQSKVLFPDSENVSPSS